MEGISLSTKLSKLQQVGVRVWNWPSPGAQPTTKREITVLRLHVQIGDNEAIVSPEEYHGPVAITKATKRIVNYLYHKYYTP